MVWIRLEVHIQNVYRVIIALLQEIASFVGTLEQWHCATANVLPRRNHVPEMNVRITSHHPGDVLEIVVKITEIIFAIVQVVRILPLALLHGPLVPVDHLVEAEDHVHDDVLILVAHVLTFSDCFAQVQI